MAWPHWLYWLLLSLAALAAAILLALHLLRFRYSFDYVFPYSTEGRMVFSFLWMQKVIPVGGRNEDIPEAGEADASVDEDRATSPVGPAPATGPGDFLPGGTNPRPLTPRSGQDGFIALPWKVSWRERSARFKARLVAASRKWVLDPVVWRRLAAYLLDAGLRTLRFVGPSMERLHVGSEDVLNLGRFAGVWSSLGAMFPFLACPVEYGFNERPFALRLRISGGCTALGLIAFAIALAFTFPWSHLIGRFLACWRRPRLNRWQRKLASAMA